MTDRESEEKRPYLRRPIWAWWPIIDSEVVEKQKVYLKESGVVTVKRVFDLALMKCSLRTIATVTGLSVKEVRGLLQNAMVVGGFEYRGLKIPGVISEELFAKVKMLREERRHGRGGSFQHPDAPRKKRRIKQA
jgi:hypothetical protein